MMNPAEFRNIAETNERLWWFQGMHAIVFDQLAAAVSGRTIRRVVEAGCGTGHFARALERRFGWQVLPWDLSLVGLRNAQTLGLDGLAAADIRAMPLRPESVDLLLCLDVLVHLTPEESGRALQGFASALRSGGLLLLRVSAMDMLRSRHSVFVGERQRYTRGRLVRQLHEAGLTIRRLTYLNSLLLPVALTKFRIWEPLTDAPPESGLQMPPPWLNWLLRMPLELERRLVAAGVDFPAGQSLLAVAEKL
jgi:SAM-dependent methyltransferase